MNAVEWSNRPERLRRPVFVCAFEGWGDAGDAASLAANSIIEAFAGEEIAGIDLETFVDLRETRPTVSLVAGEIRAFEWPRTVFTAVRAPRAPRDLVIVTGPEPGLRWRAWCHAVIDVASSLDCSMVVTLGAFLADQPHTRPVPIAGSASDSDLAERMGLTPSNYEGPTGIASALHWECHGAGIPTVSLWAAVPHYIAAMPNPKAALALVRRLESLTAVIVEAGELEQDALEHERQVEQAVAADSDLQGFVEQLEEAAEEESGEAEDLPSADAIERDVQRFLRQQDPGLD